MPLPHISTLPPSLLYMSMRKSAFFDFLSINAWSKPTPNLRSESFFTIFWMPGNSFFVQSSKIKSLPRPCIFVKFIFISFLPPS